MESIEKKFKKEIDRKNINNKNYFWIVSILFFSAITVIYSYKTDSGIISKQTINKDFIVKSQDNLEQMYTQNKLIQEEKIANNSNLGLKDKNKEHIALNDKKQSVTTIKIAKQTQEEEQINTIKTEHSMTNKEAKILVSGNNNLQILNQKTKEEENLNNITVKEKIAIAPVSNHVNITSTTSVQLNKKIEEKMPNNLDVVVKENIISKLSMPEINFHIIECYSFEAGKTNFTNKCKDNFESFVKSNSNIKRYEVIGIIDIEDVKKLANKSESSQRKLATQRIQSVKNFLKEKTNIPINKHSYYVKSELETKGVVLRAYF